MARGIMVWSERPSLANELLSKARQLADEAGAEVRVCAFGETDAAVRDGFAAHGADVVCAIEGDSADAASCAQALSEAISRFDAGLVLIGATKMGMEVAPRVAERTGASYAAWAVELEYESAGGSTVASCMLYAGAGLATYRFTRSVGVVTAAAGAFEASAVGGRTARVETLKPSPATVRLAVLGYRPKAKGSARLEDARAVVDVGRGVKEEADLDMVRGLAGLLDAQLACSRPVSSDRDWLPEWLGLSGAKVGPELCLTVGISGAVQHVVGIRDSRVVAAVNNDEDAAIFMQADIGVVADLYDFLPALAARLQARGARPTWA
jgi:electron transfer flavoprotein alpha subunit